MSRDASCKILDLLVMTTLDLRQFFSRVINFLATSLAEKERNLSSVISALMKLEGESKKCLAQALVMRAHLALDYRDASLEQARDDAHSASRLDPQHATVWRVLADVEMKLGNSSQAIEALHKWAKYQPKFVTKVNQELQRIS